MNFSYPLRALVTHLLRLLCLESDFLRHPAYQKLPTDYRKGQNEVEIDFDELYFCSHITMYYLEITFE